MNCIFENYPQHPWLTAWTLEPRGCGTAFRERNGGYFFQTLETVGSIVPNLAQPEWALQVPVPQNSSTNILFNGFCCYLDQRKKKYAAEVVIPEPGVLWGRFSGIPDPLLVSDLPIETGEGFQWLEADESPAFLSVQNGYFCLVSKARIRADAEKLAQSYLDQDLEAYLQGELDRRAGAATLFEQMSHHDSLAVISAECMMRALRPAEGSIPLLWSQSPDSEQPEFNTNEVYPLALAWRHIDISVAEQLVLCALKIQSSSGAIPVHYSPQATHSVLEAPKPVMAQTAMEIWKVRQDPDFLQAVLPSLRRHLQWMLTHFDPKRRGLHVWQNRSELIVPEIYATDLSTVDLTSLLLTEVEAINFLRAQSPTTAGQADYFSDEQAALELNLMQQFWNEEDNAFSNGILRGKIIQVPGLPGLLPLLWKKLPNRHRGAILEKLKESGTMPGGVGVLSWRKSAMDDHSFPLLQQLFVLEALKAADPQGTLISDFSRITLQGFVEWHTLSLDEKRALKIDPVIAAYILNIQSNHQYRYHGKGGFTGRLFKLFRKSRTDRFELLVIGLTVFTVLSVHTVYKILATPPPFSSLEAQMNTAYANKDGREIVKNGMAIIHHYPEQAAPARLLAGNIFMLQGNYATAEQLYSEVRKTEPDSPAAMIALGLAQQLQGKFAEADKNYAEFCYLFDEIFPTIVAQVSQFRYIAREGFNAPPKWEEIYRYQLMHEL